MTPTTEYVTNYLRCGDLSRASMARCAKSLHVSENTLLRRLAAENARYNLLRVAEQRRRAVEAVANDPRITAGDLAEILGFSCGQSVVRFFRRVFNKSLTQYKTEANQ